MTGSERQPNVVVMLCDDLGYGDIGCYGSEMNLTPHLDAMARDGAKLTSFYMASPVCSPSRAALMTGCYPQRVGLSRGSTQRVLLPGDPIGLHPHEMTVAKALKQQGYATCCIGKWHLGDQTPFLPTRHGFDSFFGLPYSNDMFDSEGFKFPPLPLMEGEQVIEIDPDQSALTARYTEKAKSFIREQREAPFFLYFAHTYVHLPLHVPDPFMRQANNGVYGAAVECIDWSVGQLLAAIADCGLERDTLFIFTSDNGSKGMNGGSNAPLRGGKGTTWEGGMRVPCLLHWPGTIPAGSTVNELATAMDLLPTLAGLAGAGREEVPIVDGCNMWPLVSGQAGTSPYEAFYYYDGDQLEAVRSGKWKYHLKRHLLFNLEDDIGETSNVAGQFPHIVESLRTKADDCRAALGDGDEPGTERRQPGQVAHPVWLAGENRG